MNACATCLVLGSLLAGAAPLPREAGKQPDAAGRQELAKLQGSWRAVKLQIDGKPVDGHTLSKKGFGVTLDVRGDHYDFRGMGAELNGQVRIDGSSKPKRLVFTRQDGSQTTSEIAWDGDQLRLTGVHGKASARSDQGAEVWIFKRERP